MKILNKGKRQFIIGKTEAGEPIAVLPGKVSDVDLVKAKKLLAGYPDEIEALEDIPAVAEAPAKGKPGPKPKAKAEEQL